MTTKLAVTRTAPDPKSASKLEMDHRALELSATALTERLVAVENKVDELGVQALVFNLQNLMRLFDITTYRFKVNGGDVIFKRTILSGNWETGRWNLEWDVHSDGS